MFNRLNNGRSRLRQISDFTETSERYRITYGGARGVFLLNFIQHVKAPSWSWPLGRHNTRNMAVYIFGQC